MWCCAGSRADPTRLRIADIAECSSDKLSRSVRHRLRREHNIIRGIQVVLSLEKPRVKLLQIDNPSDYQVCSHGLQNPLERSVCDDICDNGIAVMHAALM